MKGKKMKMRMMIAILRLGGSLALPITAQDMSPPAASFKTNDFGMGPAVAVIRDATNDAPNTIWLTEYTTNGVDWLTPGTLGNSVGGIDPESGELVRWRKFFFFLPVETPFMTRAVPYEDPLRWFSAGTLPALTLQFQDGREVLLLEAELPTPSPQPSPPSGRGKRYLKSQF